MPIRVLRTISIRPTTVALWSALRGGALGAQFRRQVPIGGNFIGDFVASTVKLVVEVDGNRHTGRVTADAPRDCELQRLGFTVLRLSVTQEDHRSDPQSSRDYGVAPTRACFAAPDTPPNLSSRMADVNQTSFAILCGQMGEMTLLPAALKRV